MNDYLSFNQWHALQNQRNLPAAKEQTRGRRRIALFSLLALIVLAATVFFGAGDAHAQGELPQPMTDPQTGALAPSVSPDGALVAPETAGLDPVPTLDGQPAPTGELPQTADDDDPPPTPRALTYQYDIYVSAPGTGAIGIINYADEDILRYNTASGAWAKVFDGTNAGLPGATDIDAIAYQPIDLGQIWYMSFDRPTAVPGLGTVDDSDVVAYRYQLAQGGSWSMVFDGSQYGLTTDAEDIDALEYSAGSPLIISTLGSYSVPKVGGGTLRGPDEDLIAFSPALGKFALHLDATTMGIAGDNDINNVAWLRIGDDEVRFLTTTLVAKLKYSNSSYPAVTLPPHDIGLEERPMFSGPRTFGVLWDAGAHNFPKIDAMDLVKR